MKKRLWVGILCSALLVTWAVRYVTLNSGHIFSYPNNPITYYNLGEEVPYGKNMTYYGDKNYDLDGYTLCITNSELLSGTEFTSRYGEFEDQMGMIHRPYYLIVDAVFANHGNSTNAIDLNTLILRGIDWWTYCSYGQTFLANSEIENSSLYNTGTILLSNGESMSVKIVFGLESSFLTADRWQNFSNESIWVTQTIIPEEHRIVIQ